MIKLASSLDQSTLDKILSGLTPINDFTIADELIESGFMVYASHEFESVDGRKVFVSVYTRGIQKTVIINMNLPHAIDPSQQEWYAYANGSWDELTA